MPDQEQEHILSPSAPAADAADRRAAKSLTYSADFAAFWSIYPNKTGKGAAWQAWSKRANPVPAIDELLPILRTVINNSAQWQRDGGKYIPHPATWINQRRWEDSVSESTPATGRDRPGNGGFREPQPISTRSMLAPGLAKQIFGDES